MSARLIGKVAGSGKSVLARARRQDTRGATARSRMSSSAAQREVFGAIDLGSNNCRLLIAKPSPANGFRIVEAFSRIVRLGEGLHASGNLSEAAMDRTIDALSVCAEKLRRRRVTRLRAVATEACRRAENGEAFVRRVKETTGIQLEVISNGEEIRLAADGCAPLLDPRIPNALIFDIGGGSTEISWFRVGRGRAGGNRDNASLEVVDWCSLPLGVVNISERYGGYHVSAESYRSIKDEVRRAALDFEARNNLKDLVRRCELQLLGTSGTVTTLTGVHLALPRYERALVDGYFLSIDSVRRISARIASMSYEERRTEGCIGVERADLVIAGCAVLEALCDLWPADRLRVADRGLREGMLFFMLREMLGVAERRSGPGTAGPVLS